MSGALPLAGQVALVTGASGGIGGAIARTLAASGADLLLHGRDEERLEAQAVSTRRAASRPRVETWGGDLADRETVRELARRATSLFGAVDVLVHAAGAFHMGSFDETPAAELDRQVRINLRAPYVLTRALLPSLRERHGQVVFVNSSVTGRARVGAYAASKHALKAFADSLRDEVNRDDVRVVSVFPGRTASAMQKRIHELEGRAYDAARLLQPGDVAAAILNALILPRTAEVTDLHIRPMRP
jgi:short-subunit dehydrogenase